MPDLAVISLRAPLSTAESWGSKAGSAIDGGALKEVTDKSGITHTKKSPIPNTYVSDRSRTGILQARSNLIAT